MPTHSELTTDCETEGGGLPIQTERNTMGLDTFVMVLDVREV